MRRRADRPGPSDLRRCDPAPAARAEAARHRPVLRWSQWPVSGRPWYGGRGSCRLRSSRGRQGAWAERWPPSCGPWLGPGAGRAERAGAADGGAGTAGASEGATAAGGEPPSRREPARTHMPPHTDAKRARSYKGHSRRCHGPRHRRSWWPRRSRSAGGPAGDNASALGAEPLVPLASCRRRVCGGAGDQCDAPLRAGPRRPAGASGPAARCSTSARTRRWRRTPPGAATAPARPRSTICRRCSPRRNRGSECGGWIRRAAHRASTRGRPDDADFDKRVPPEQVAPDSCGCWTARRQRPVRAELREER